MIYLCNPEYFGEYARRFIQLGVRAVGGCCGTTPEHIKWVANAVRSLTPGGKKAISQILKSDVKTETEVALISQKDKSAFGEKLAAKKFIVTAELTPPKGCDADSVIVKAQQLKDIGIDAINIPDGPRASARLSPLALALLIEKKVGIETILHYCCRDRNICIQSDLLRAYAGFKKYSRYNGRPAEGWQLPAGYGGFDIDSIGLVNIVA